MFAFNPNNEDEVTNQALATLFLKQQSSTNQQLDSDDIKVMMNDKIFATYNVAD